MKLSPITKIQEIKPFSVVDIETKQWTEFIVLGFYNGETYLEFRTLAEFVNYIEGNTEYLPRDFYAHFGGKFDFNFLLNEFIQNPKAEILRIVPRGSMILCFDVVIGGFTFTFNDSSALLSFSLRKLTDQFDVETKKGEWDHEKTQGWSPELSEYLKADCIGLYQVLLKFWSQDIIRQAGPAKTMASQALRVFRTYLKKDLWALTGFASEFCRKSYYGGRVEIFKPFTEKTIYEYDVNSLYPFVMAKNLFPDGFASYVYGSEFDKNKLGIWECRVTTPQDIFLPVLGVVRYQDKKGNWNKPQGSKTGKFIFPKGTFTGHFTSAEILYARSQGYKIELLRGVQFSEKTRLFKKYVETLYKLRFSQGEGTVLSIICKLLMNSLYGKFGMNLNKENITQEFKEGNKEFRTFEASNGKAYELFKEKKVLDSYTNTAIASFVTSYARILMHEMMSKIPENDLYYTDTDSIWTTKKMRSGRALGALKLEKAHEGGAAFLLPKVYKSNFKLKFKGFNDRKMAHLTLEDFKHALEGDLSKFKAKGETKFATFRTALSKHKKFVTMTKMPDKQIKSLYDKRIIIKNKETDKITTEAITLKEF